ncbi:hypothetical protein COCMIDRAFT_9740 [Bipolaris oryzae ATCC 44560]|uniref:Uncharacterized protein n=1 Tax=Bipolaris oryzae ATCC 44560 TaxID=930090 RepID=W6YXS7_COCMI|nr:uncharacterized protein COCMIDRAFT_9740 [Bipolaris oryzae ATCC 44560]EUC40364.1 hypothetical protein COCMIDRAFT_9740 [Bipolaris oryzae ATCC 44560]
MTIIPKYGDWITFPLEQLSPVELEWWSDKTQQQARYYVDKCWFGDRVDKTDSEDGYRKGLAPKGETLIFIASEYIERRMQGAPHLKNLHLADIMEKKYKDKDAARNWALLQLDEKFHYGQNNGKTFRWIVYHPPAIAGRERKMYQHRFVENVALKIANLGIELAGIAVSTTTGAVTSGKVQVTGIVPILTRVKNLFAANKGHALHQFSSSEQAVSDPPKPGSQDPQSVITTTLSNGTVAKVQEPVNSAYPLISMQEPDEIVFLDIEDETHNTPSQTKVPASQFGKKQMGVGNLRHEEQSELVAPRNIQHSSPGFHIKKEKPT